MVADFAVVPCFAVDCRWVPRGVESLPLWRTALADALSGDTVAGMTAGDRLDSWKEIAAYLKRDVTTVQRWEKREGMPIHRHVHDKLGSVYAFRPELDAWARSRNLRVATDHEPLSPVLTEPNPDADAAPVTVAAAPPRRHRPILVWWMGAAVLLAAGAAGWWRLQRTDYFWRNPLDGARFQTVTDFGGAEQAAALSRDGHLVAFLSDRDGQMDVWLTQVGTGDAHNLTRGRVSGIVNPSLRTLGFSPDGALVTFWRRRGADPGAISIWAVPALGGDPRPYLEGTAEYDWSADGSRLVYHTTGPGDPTFVRDPGQAGDRQIFRVAPGRHAHFPTWAPDGSFIYFVQGSLPDAMDIWRIKPSGGAAERITFDNARVSYPVLLDRRTLMYLATDRDGSGPWIYAMDIEHRIAHRVSTGVDRYTSLAAAGDGRRLVATLANPNGTLWRLPVSDPPVDANAATPVSLATGRGFSPRYGPDYLLYVSSKGTGDMLWKLAGEDATALWSAPDTRIVGGPEIAPDGHRVAFTAEGHGRTSLYVMDADGSNARVVTASLALGGAPAWSPDGQSLTSAVNVNGTPRLYRIALDGTSTPLVGDYALDPVWSPAGDFVAYSGPDVGTTFPLRAVTPAGAPYRMPNLMLTRGARRLRFLHGGRALVVMRGDLDHKDLWAVDLDTGTERQLTKLAPDFNIRDFDVSPDGREVILERVQEHSDIVLIDLDRRG